LQKRKWKVLQHPPHSPDLAPSDLYLFKPFKNFLSGKSFEGQNTMQKTIVQYFTSLGKEHYREGIFKLVKRWNKCLNANEDYVEK
jgi:histone-lysine N-methyltransferase SETMAR